MESRRRLNTSLKYELTIEEDNFCNVTITKARIKEGYYLVIEHKAHGITFTSIDCGRKVAEVLSNLVDKSVEEIKNDIDKFLSE